MRLGHRAAADDRGSHFRPPPERVFTDTDAAMTVPLLADMMGRALRRVEAQTDVATLSGRLTLGRQSPGFFKLRGSFGGRKRSPGVSALFAHPVEGRA